MVERDRIEEGIRPPDQAGWTEQAYKIWLFDNLIYNVDRNLNNVLATGDWRVYLIDHSRSFRSLKELKPIVSTPTPREALTKIDTQARSGVQALHSNSAGRVSGK